MSEKAYLKEHARLIKLLSVGEKLTKEKEEQQAELKGEGLFTSIAPIAWDILKQAIRKEYPPKERRLLGEYGDWKVKHVLVRREPLQSKVTSFLNVLTAGQLEQAKRQANYDNLYHLGLVLSLEKDGKIVPIMVEKNEVIRFTVNPATNARVESIQLATPSPPVTFAEFMEKGAKAKGDSFFTYDAFTNNCQQFVLGLLRANGIASSYAEQFINQSAEKLIQKLPSYTQGIVRGITDLGALVNRVFEGKGKYVAEKQMSRNTEYIRGKAQERDDAPTGKFDARGNDVWAWRSGRTYMGETSGGARDFSSPEVGNGKPRAGRLSALTRRAASPSSSEDETEYEPLTASIPRPRGRGTPDYDTVELMSKGAVGAAKPSKAKARGAMVSKLMKEKGLTLGQASKYIKEKGLL